MYDYRDDMSDLFAGHLWERQPSPAVNKFRRMLKREHSYDEERVMPVGSRYHPERAHIRVEEAVV